MIPWPDVAGKVRRASVNSFGYGGANAHAIIEQARPVDTAHHVASLVSADEVLSFDHDGDDSSSLKSDLGSPHVLLLSANDASSLKANIEALCKHLANPRVKVSLPDLAYTLSERRSRLWHRAFVVTSTTEMNASDFFIGKKGLQQPRVGFVFTGQGAQWPQMGKGLVRLFPRAREILRRLDEALQGVPNPPSWSLERELTEPRSADHVRQPEFSQPLVTAMQLCLLDVLESWGIRPSSVVGHSSGEIAAAYSAGLLDRAAAIKCAFYRGRAAVNCRNDADRDVGMLAVGLGTDAVAPFLSAYEGRAWIACFNSPSSLTISGRTDALDVLAQEIKAAGHFARRVQVDLAYHSELMGIIGEEYESLLNQDGVFDASSQPPSSPFASMFSSVTSAKLTEATPTNSLYWKTNMVSPVRFEQAVQAMLSQPDGQSPEVLIEVGPSGALAGPVSQILKSLPSGSDISYAASWARDSEALKALYGVAGRMSVLGAAVNFTDVNGYSGQTVRTITDLPNYSWNHSIKYWHESAASKDWRFRQFITHDLIGSKIFGTSWHNPTWRKHVSASCPKIIRPTFAGPQNWYTGENAY